MANGGWYGTREEWERIEAPLFRVELIIEEFATRLGLPLSRNHKDWPDRSMRWGNDPSNLIQLYLADQEKLTWHLWIASSQDRDLKRYWKQERLIDNQPISAFEYQLAELLTEAYETLTRWSTHPKTFDFAGHIQPLP